MNRETNLTPGCPTHTPGHSLKGSCSAFSRRQRQLVFDDKRVLNEVFSDIHTICAMPIQKVLKDPHKLPLLAKVLSLGLLPQLGVDSISRIRGKRHFGQ